MKKLLSTVLFVSSALSFASGFTLYNKTGATVYVSGSDTQMVDSTCNDRNLAPNEECSVNGKWANYGYANFLIENHSVHVSHHVNGDYYVDDTYLGQTDSNQGDGTEVCASLLPDNSLSVYDC